ncbi:zinc finger and BTB domain-containing protein 26-like [Culicoides brevitarsis]|uniref:zinc finger and BTB domain-containing protein 26-like n=1 Tax=Culicoides brevitarsis TaxID=469753 RepID=UPI00307B30FF
MLMPKVILETSGQQNSDPDEEEYDHDDEGPEMEIQDHWSNPSKSQLYRLMDQLGRFVCPRIYCRRGYKHVGSLQRHLKYECGGVKMFRCHMCGKAFSQKFPLKRHVEYQCKMLKVFKFS